MNHNDALTDDELAAWLRLMATSGVGDMTAHVLLKAFGLPQSIFAQSYMALTKVVSERVANALLAAPSDAWQRHIDETLAWRTQAENHVVSLSCRDYPQHLLTTADPPALLYVKGRLELLNHNANLAIVGSRNATAQGISNAEQFAEQLAAGGLNIISGLALGIDAAAHRGALMASKNNPAAGSTIAVIGTGCDIIYPARNRDLAHQVAQHGVIVSEFPLGTKAMSSNFPRRNRIISGLSQGVLVVEAALKSGSLITARQAAEQNREVFAIPGSIHSPLARGCHALIRQGAKLVESAQDILEELQIVPQAPQSSLALEVNAAPQEATTSDVQAQILAALGFDPCDLDTLAARTALPVAELSGELMLLELDGRIEKRPGNVYCQVI